MLYLQGQKELCLFIMHSPFLPVPVLLCFVQERLFLVILPDFHTTDFTADSFRKFLYKFYNARVFVRSGYFFNMVLQLLNQLFTGAVLYSLDNTMVAFTT